MKKTILIIGMLLLILLSACDFLKSKELSPEKKLEFAEKCSKAGKTYFNEFRDVNGGDNYSWDNPEFHYSTLLNTCLIHIRYLTVPVDSPSYQYNQVIDVFSNKAILYGWFIRDIKKKTETLRDTPNPDVPNYTSLEYFDHKDKLFKE